MGHMHTHTSADSVPFAASRKRSRYFLTRRVPLMNKILAKAQTSLTKRLETLREKEEGATAVEYALIVGLVSLVIIAALALIGPAVVTFVNTDIIPNL